MGQLPKMGWLYWQDRHYASLMQAKIKTKLFLMNTKTVLDEIETKALKYFQCNYVPKVLSENPATQYIMAMNLILHGDLLEAGKTYKVNVPAEMPVKQFWAD